MLFLVVNNVVTVSFTVDDSMCNSGFLFAFQSVSPSNIPESALLEKPTKI